MDCSDAGAGGDDEAGRKVCNFSSTMEESKVARPAGLELVASEKTPPVCPPSWIALPFMLVRSASLG